MHLLCDDQKKKEKTLMANSRSCVRGQLLWLYPIVQMNLKFKALIQRVASKQFRIRFDEVSHYQSVLELHQVNTPPIFPCFSSMFLPFQFTT